MIMQDAFVDKELADLDLSKVAALQQKRTLAFVNHFVGTTAQFLNNFMKQCESKLMHFERKLEKVEAALVLLETRLSSIPEVNTSTTPHPVADTITPIEHPISTDNIDSMSTDPPADDNLQENDTEDNKEPAESQHSPEYDRFVKMVQVGVPLEAVKLKVSLEGLDPKVFEKIMKK